MAIFFEIVILCIGCVYSFECMIRIRNSEAQLEDSIVLKMQLMFILQAVHFFLYIFGLVFYCCSDTKFAEDPELNYEERANQRKNEEQLPKFNDLPESFKNENSRSFKEFMKNEGQRELDDFESLCRPDMNRAKDRRLSALQQEEEKSERLFDIDAGIGENAACGICFEKMKENQRVAEVPCPERHIFHVACIKKWIINNDTCPICQADFGLIEWEN
jgi:hypothetical protein